VQWSPRNRLLSFEHMKLVEKGYKFLAKGNNQKGRVLMFSVKIIHIAEAYKLQKFIFIFLYCKSIKS